MSRSSAKQVDSLKQRLSNLQLNEYYHLEAARRTAQSLSESTKKRSKISNSPAQFVKLANRCIEVHKKYLELQQSMIGSILNMDEDTKLIICFNIADVTREGRISSEALRSLMENSFGCSSPLHIEKMACSHDDRILDVDDFKELLKLTTENVLGASHIDMAEYAIISDILSHSGIKQLETLGEDVMKSVIKGDVNESSMIVDKCDDRMATLFDFFDVDGDGFADFTEVAVGLKKITNDDMCEAAFGAIEMLLAIDQKNRRKLNFQQFSQLIQNICSAARADFDDVADNFILSVLSQTSLTPEEMDQLMIAESVFKEEEFSTDEEVVSGRKSQCFETLVNSPHVGKLRRIFGLFDLNRDGTVDYDEIVKGLNKYKDILMIDEHRHTAVLEQILVEGELLSMKTFPDVIIGYANMMGVVDTHDFIDFLCVHGCSIHQDGNSSFYKIKDEVKEAGLWDAGLFLSV